MGMTDLEVWHDGDPPAVDESTMVLIWNGKWALLEAPPQEVNKAAAPALLSTLVAHPDIPAIGSTPTVMPLMCNCEPCHPDCCQRGNYYVLAYGPA